MVTVAALIFVTVTGSELVFSIFTVPNFKLVGDNLMANPTPLSSTVCDPPPPLSVMRSFDVRGPPTVGLNATVIRQCAPVNSVVPHADLKLKSPAFAPVNAILLIESVPLKSLVINSVWLAEVLTACAP